MRHFDIKHFLPCAPDDSSTTGQNRRAYLIHFLCWTWMIVITAILSVRLLLMSRFLVHDLVVIFVTILVLTTCLSLNRKGHSLAAAYLFLSATMASLTVLVYFTGGVKAPSITGFLPTIFVAGILFGKRCCILSAIVSILITFVIAILEMNGLLPASNLFNNPVSYWLGFATSGIMIGVMQYISSIQTDNAFRTITQQEERYHSLVDHASDPILVLNADTSINEANSSACKLLGYRHDELLQMKLADLFAPGEIEKLPLQAGHLKEHKILMIERKWITKEGTILDMEVHTRVLDGGGYLSIARDITERKQTEKKLRDSEMRYRNIFDNVIDVFFQTSLDGVILEVSPSIKNHTGYTREELIGAQAVNIYYNPGDREQIMKLLKEKGDIKDFEVKFRGSDGQLVYVSVSAKLFRATDDHPAHIDGVFNNITERKLAEIKLKQSEEKHRALTENISDAIILINESGKIIYQSAAVGRIGGYSADEVKEKTIFDFIHPDDVPRSLEFFKRSLEMPGVPMQNQYRSRHKNGHYIWIEGTIMNLLANESVQAFIVNYHDVTERVKHLNDIEEQNKKLREIAWIQSHVVRAPLARMMGLVYIFKDIEMNSVEFKTWTEHFFYTADELDAIIHDISVKSKDVHIEG